MCTIPGHEKHHLEDEEKVRCELQCEYVYALPVHRPAGSGSLQSMVSASSHWSPLEIFQNQGLNLEKSLIPCNHCHLVVKCLSATSSDSFSWVKTHQVLYSGTNCKNPRNLVSRNDGLQVVLTRQFGSMALSWALASPHSPGLSCRC